MVWLLQDLSPVFLDAGQNWSLSVFTLDETTLRAMAFHLFNMAVFAFIMAKLLYRPVRDFMRKRSEKIAAQLSEAEEGLATANALKADYEAKVKHIDAERAKILDAAFKQADENSKRIIDDAKKEANLLVERAAKDAQAEMERLKEEIRLQIIDVSTVMAGKFVANSIDSQTQERLFAEAVAELESATWPS